MGDEMHLVETVAELENIDYLIDTFCYDVEPKTARVAHDPSLVSRMVQ